jgi:hypothetical protein
VWPIVLTLWAVLALSFGLAESHISTATDRTTMHGSGGLGLAEAGLENWAGMALLGLLGFVLGFALNHGSICTVIATRELVSEKRPARFIALVECAVWAALVYAILERSPA